MRLYAKLASIVFIACCGQALVARGVAADAYFALRCLAVTTAGDAAAEAELVCECQTDLAAQQNIPVTVVAYNDSAGW